jgi:hypothetical protein
LGLFATGKLSKKFREGGLEVARVTGETTYGGQMGKRKAKKPAPKKSINKKLSTQFDCPFCNHDKSIEVKM